MGNVYAIKIHRYYKQILTLHRTVKLEIYKYKISFKL